MSPQWSQTDQEVLERAILKNSVEDEKSYPTAEENTQLAQDLENIDMAAVKKEEKAFHVAKVDKTQQATHTHGDMAMVEWYILAHANWLTGHSGTSYSESAAGLGLSPLGHMERFDMIHGSDHASTTFRR